MEAGAGTNTDVATGKGTGVGTRADVKGASVAVAPAGGVVSAWARHYINCV
jgi:hypothetical protein